MNYIAESNIYDDLFTKLAELNKFYYQEAEKCAQNEAYFAACVMLGSSLETILKNLGLPQDHIGLI